MRKRSIITIVIVCTVVAGAVIAWAKLADSQSNNNQAKTPTDEERILALAKQDPAASDYELIASSATIIKKENNWYSAAITYLYSSTNTYATYPSILLRDADGDFSIVAGFNDINDIATLTKNGIPLEIGQAAIAALPPKEVPEDMSP